MAASTDSGDAEGELFSRVYLKPTTVLRDSERFRRRLWAWFSETLTTDEVLVFSSLARQELGCGMPVSRYPSSYGDFFTKGELRDVLDSVSIIRQILNSRTPFPAPSTKAIEWID